MISKKAWGTDDSRDRPSTGPASGLWAAIQGRDPMSYVVLAGDFHGFMKLLKTTRVAGLVYKVSLQNVT